MRTTREVWLRGVDLNHRPLGYEPNELPDCSTPQLHRTPRHTPGQCRCESAGAAQGYNGCVPRFLVPAVFALATALAAQPGFFPLQDVKPGMRGIGRTVFSGSQVDEFQVEILGVLDNVGPKESLI